MAHDAGDEYIIKAVADSNAVRVDSIIPLLDYTLLEPEASDELILSFKQKAQANSIAAVCVYANHLPHLESLTCKKACVVNFPDGLQSNESIIGQLKAIFKSYTVDEIDYVFPWKQYQSGDRAYCLKQSQQVIEMCHEANKAVKVIVESGAFSVQNDLFELALALVHQGCNFLKTSTGKYPVGASMNSADVLLQAIACSGLSCGIKLSGGISEIHQAQQYVKLAQLRLNKVPHSDWIRIGASRLLDAIILNHTTNSRI